VLALTVEDDARDVDVVSVTACLLNVAPV